MHGLLVGQRLGRDTLTALGDHGVKMQAGKLAAIGMRNGDRVGVAVKRCAVSQGMDIDNAHGILLYMILRLDYTRYPTRRKAPFLKKCIKKEIHRKAYLLFAADLSPRHPEAGCPS